MDKVIRDGKVVVLYDEFGSWYTDHYVEELLYYPKLVELVEQHKAGIIEDMYPIELREYFKGDTHEELYTWVSLRTMQIAWVPVGKVFTIQKDDYKEVVMLQEDYTWHTA